MEFLEIFVFTLGLGHGHYGKPGSVGFSGGLASRLTVFCRDGSSLEYTHGSAGKGWFFDS